MATMDNYNLVKHQQGGINKRSAPLLLGHRGARAEMTENMPAAITHACHLQAYGLSGIEFDVQLSADGQLVVFHDDSLVRLAGHQSRVDQLTLAEIRRVRIQGQSIFALNDLLTYPLQPNPLTPNAAASYLPSSIYQAMMSFEHIELEVKTHERTNYSALLRALEDSLIGSQIAQLPIVLTSFDQQLLALLQLNRKLSAIPRGLLSENPAMMADLGHIARRLGCSQVGIHYPLIDAVLMRHCHRLDLSVSAWTVNDVDEARRLRKLGVDTLITDYPTAFITSL